MPFDANAELTLSFTVTEWNQVLAQLSKGPYDIVAPLIGKISMQAQRHEAEQQQKAAHLAAQAQQAGDISYTNGEMRQQGPFSLVIPEPSA